MNRFWDYSENGNELRLEGEISSETWWGDEVTPKMFRDELSKHPGPLTVYINSPGGDVFAASEIYTMLLERKGDITVKVDALAASAASFIAMAGGTVLIAPTAFIMVHDPLTAVWGNRDDLKEAIKTLDEVKEGLINAYELKTGLSREKIAALMNGEGTYLSARSAVELGFADGIIGEEAPAKDETGKPVAPPVAAHKRACVYNSGSYTEALLKRLTDSVKSSEPKPAPEPEESPESKEVRAWLLALADSGKKPAGAEPEEESQESKDVRAWLLALADNHND